MHYFHNFTSIALMAINLGIVQMYNDNFGIDIILEKQYIIFMERPNSHLKNTKMHIAALTCFEKEAPLSTSPEALPLQAAQFQEACHFQSISAYLYCLNFLYWHCCLKQTDSYFVQVELMHAPYQANTI